MNIQILLLFTISVVLLELVQLPEARKYMRPWKLHRSKPRWHPFPRPSKHRFKGRPLKYRHPKWHSHRYAPYYIGHEEPYTIEIELPKHYDALRDHSHSQRWSKRHHEYEYFDDDEDEAQVFISGKKRERIKLINRVKPKLRIKISRGDNLPKPPVINIRNMTQGDTTYRHENFSYQGATPPRKPNHWGQLPPRDLRGI